MNLPLPLRLLLWPFSLLYGAAARLQAWLYALGIYTAKRLDAPVVSVGNLTVGGTGKTPMVLWLAEKLLAQGKHVAILSRGYRGSGGTSDETEMLKGRLGDRVFFGVGPDRYMEGRRLESENHVDVFLLDDGFQHQQLARALDIVLVDSTVCLSKEWMLPAGRMREPISALRRATATVLTRAHGESSESVANQSIKKISGPRTFTAETKVLGYRRVSSGQLEQAIERELPPQPVFAFCGIGNPLAFFHDLAGWGITAAGQKAFRDHHSFSAQDIRTLEERAQSVGAKSLVTTEKDIQNLTGRQFSKLPLYACVIELQIREEKEFCDLLNKKLARREEFLA
ncbi:MAG TPA: tetraacyldisaccharide 4'-kinase [Candidatus Acidoferrum sp.]|jgi:tetraacyldisaccharide 4'-kinase